MINRPENVKDEHLKYLDGLRRSGVTNMWGSPAYVEREFSVNNKNAGIIVGYWMDSFSERHPT